MPLLVEYAPMYAYDGENPVEAFVQHGRELRFIRPSRRNRISTPELPQEEFLPLPPDLELTRTPRYAQRKAYRTEFPTHP